MELLLVIALVAVVAAVGAPAVFHNFNRDADHYMIDGLMGELEYARSMGLYDLKNYAVFKTTANSPIFECATRTVRLEGNVVFNESQTLFFDQLGRLVDSSGNPLAATNISLRSGPRVVGIISVTPQGLIKKQ